MSSCSVTVFAALENPRQPFSGPKKKTFLFDSQLYLGLPKLESLVGVLRYFNNDNITFGAMGLYLIHMKVFLHFSNLQANN